MAKIYGKYSCGCDGCVNVTGHMKDREWKVKKHFERMCPDCYKKYIEKKSMESCVFSMENSLPVLEGTEKQEKWADSIRADIFKDILSMTGYKFYDKINSKKVELSADGLNNILSFLSKEKSAKFWIENRTTDAMIKYAWRYMRKEN